MTHHMCLVVKKLLVAAMHAVYFQYTCLPAVVLQNILEAHRTGFVSNFTHDNVQKGL